MATLLLTRPEAQSRQLIKSLAARGASPRVVMSPIMEIRPREIVLPEGAELVLTSQNAVAALPAGRWRAWCVGDRTAAAARAAGLDAVSAGRDIEALLALLVARRPPPLVHVRGTHIAGKLVERLGAAGLLAEEIVAYDQAPLPLTREAANLLASAGEVILPLYSPRSARLVAGHAGPWRASIRAVAISDATARAFDRPAIMKVAAAPSGEALELAILDVLATAEGSRLVDRGGAG